ncbi:LysR family transcriptional regulator [Neptuniibacter sp. CAU 1671]|uniref:LysR family transcriptional regulator n=1 Tax=Neptuniibacter sp. CAU 1671 TaxID=3032593 RepID=UPI0023DC3F29|nr:LysR family transcriptional regulator [Neptuniibacter sp. CAU 1671]MDF2180895.1 LysR family transcriptional regulator [Neptuniibacter sp. CAU 1671]
MNLNDIRLFIHVIEQNSFTAAAEQLNLQKSTISRRIAQLEDELGVRLLQRTTRKLSLTEEGHDLYHRCLPLFNELSHITDQVAARRHEPKGRLRITMPPEMGIFIMNDVIGSFMEQHPGIQLDVELSARLVDLVEEGIDLALRVGELVDSSLIGRKLAESEIALYASPAYLMRHGTPETPADLQQHSCIAGLLNHTGWAFTNWNDGKQVNLDFRMRANSLSFCREMILQNIGIGRMPKAFCEEMVKDGKLVHLLENYHLQPVQIHALYPSRRHLNPRVRLFIDHMLSMIKDHPWLIAQ